MYSLSFYTNVLIRPYLHKAPPRCVGPYKQKKKTSLKKEKKNRSPRADVRMTCVEVASVTSNIGRYSIYIYLSIYLNTVLWTVQIADGIYTGDVKS